MVVAKYVVEERGWGVKKAIRSKLQIYILNSWLVMVEDCLFGLMHRTMDFCFCGI